MRRSLCFLGTCPQKDFFLHRASRRFPKRLRNVSADFRIADLENWTAGVPAHWSRRIGATTATGIMNTTDVPQSALQKAVLQACGTCRAVSISCRQSSHLTWRKTTCYRFRISDARSDASYIPYDNMQARSIQVICLSAPWLL